MNRTEQRKESWEVCCLLPHSDKDLIPMVQKGGKRLEEERRKKREREREREKMVWMAVLLGMYIWYCTVSMTVPDVAVFPLNKIFGC